MKIRVILVLFLLGIGWLLYFSDQTQAAPEAAGRLIISEELGRAKAFLDNGNAEEAWKILRALLREDPYNAGVNVLLSQAAFATGRDNQALAAMERLAEANPENAKLQLALAKAYARAGDESSSAAALEQARRLDPGIATAEEQEDLEKAAAMAAKRYDRFMATGRLAMGFIWDSNATCGLDSRDITIGDYNFHLNEDAEKKDSLGEYLNGNLNWSWKLGEDSDWHLAGDLAFYGKIYNRDLPSNQSFTWGRASLGLREISDKHMVDIRAVVNNARYDPFEDAIGAGGEVTWIYQLAPGFDFIANGNLESRTYMDVAEKSGMYWNAGVYSRFHFGQANHTFLVGLKGIGASTQEERYSYEGLEAIARLDLALLRKLTVSPFAAWRHAAYHAPATNLSAGLGEDDRIDSLLLCGLGLTWNWTQHLATEIGWQYIKNFSTTPIYRYDQHQINTGLVFNF